MMNQKMLISIGLGVTAFICFVLMFVFLEMGNYSEAKDEQSCKKESETQYAKDPKTCAAWDGSRCRKGKPLFLGILCVAQPNPLPLIFMVMGLMFLIAAVVVGILSRRGV